MSADLSNKGLAILLVLSIAISIGGTLISLNKLNNGITGYATDSAVGTASLQIQALVQITLTDATVDFGVCDLNGSIPVTYDSNSTTNHSLEDPNSQCSGIFPDVMTVENRGNRAVNLTISSDTSAADFVNSPSGPATFAFVGINKDGGCADGLETNFTNFTYANTPYLLCRNFTSVDTSDEINIAFRVTLPPDALPGTRTATITITAEEI